MHFLAGCDMHGQNEVNTIVFHSNIECFDNMIVIKFLSTDCNDCRGNQPRENVCGLHNNVLSVFQSGRSWQPLGESKIGHKTFVGRAFAIFATNMSFCVVLRLRVVANLQI